MSIDTIWTTLYSSIAISITVSVLAGGFYLIGRSVFTLLRLPAIESSSITIAAGLASTTLIGWYAYRLGIPLNSLIIIIFLFTLALFMFSLRRCVTTRSIYPSNSLYALPLFTLAFSVQAIITFGFANDPIGTLGNNDIYDWSNLANYILGLPGYDNVFTIDGGTAQQYRIDSFGTFYILALSAKFISSTPLEATTVFTILSLSLIALSIFDLVKTSFYFKDRVSFGVALLVTAGSFFFYIAYNNFYGQILATFFYLSIISSLLHIEKLNSESNRIGFIKRILLPLFPLLGILLAYQSGFLVFAVFSIIFCFIHIAIINIYSEEPATAMSRSNILLLPFLASILLALALLPELSWHTAQRTLAVKDALNGWPLPLISPKYLLSIPSLRAFPASSGNIIKYILILSASGFIFTFAYFTAKRHSKIIASRFVILSMLFLASLLAYLLAYYLKGGIYQVWKFAAFVVLPMSFMFYVSCALLMQQSKIHDGLLRKLLMPLIITGCVFLVIVSPSKLRLESISHKIEQMKESRDILLKSGIDNIVLNDMTYGETMMAFNILSNDFRLYPIVPSYVQPVDNSLVQQLNPDNTRVLVSSKCYASHDNQANDGEYTIIQLDEMQAGNSKYLFGSLCPNTIVSLLDGFSGRELWGVWTVGNKAQMKIEIPSALIGKSLNLTFNVQPFGSQSVTVEAGNHSENWSIGQEEKLTLTIPPEINNQKQLLLSFHIDHPQSPSKIDSASTDTRLLGIGFISLAITDAH